MASAITTMPTAEAVQLALLEQAKERNAIAREHNAIAEEGNTIAREQVAATKQQTAIFSTLATKADAHDVILTALESKLNTVATGSSSAGSVAAIRKPPLKPEEPMELIGNTIADTDFLQLLNFSLMQFVIADFFGLPADVIDPFASRFRIEFAARLTQAFRGFFTKFQTMASKYSPFPLAFVDILARCVDRRCALIAIDCAKTRGMRLIHYKELIYKMEEQVKNMKHHQAQSLIINISTRRKNYDSKTLRELIGLDSSTPSQDTQTQDEESENSAVDEIARVAASMNADSDSDAECDADSETTLDGDRDQDVVELTDVLLVTHLCESNSMPLITKEPASQAVMEVSTLKESAEDLAKVDPEVAEETSVTTSTLKPPTKDTTETASPALKIAKLPATKANLKLEEDIKVPTTEATAMAPTREAVTEGPSTMEPIVDGEKTVAESKEEYLAPVSYTEVAITGTDSQTTAEQPNPPATEEDTQASTSMPPIMALTPEPNIKKPAKLDPVTVGEGSEPVTDLGASTSSFGSSQALNSFSPKSSTTTQCTKLGDEVSSKEEEKPDKEGDAKDDYETKGDNDPDDDNDSRDKGPAPISIVRSSNTDTQENSSNVRNSAPIEEPPSCDAPHNDGANNPQDSTASEAQPDLMDTEEIENATPSVDNTGAMSSSETTGAPFSQPQSQPVAPQVQEEDMSDAPETKGKEEQMDDAPEIKKKVQMSDASPGEKDDEKMDDAPAVAPTQVGLDIGSEGNTSSSEEVEMEDTPATAAPQTDDMEDVSSIDVNAPLQEETKEALVAAPATKEPAPSGPEVEVKFNRGGDPYFSIRKPEVGTSNVAASAVNATSVVEVTMGDPPQGLVSEAQHHTPPRNNEIAEAPQTQPVSEEQQDRSDRAQQNREANPTRQAEHKQARAVITTAGGLKRPGRGARALPLAMTGVPQTIGVGGTQSVVESPIVNTPPTPGSSQVSNVVRVPRVPRPDWEIMKHILELVALNNQKQPQQVWDPFTLLEGQYHAAADFYLERCFYRTQAVHGRSPTKTENLKAVEREFDTALVVQSRQYWEKIAYVMLQKIYEKGISLGDMKRTSWARKLFNAMADASRELAQKRIGHMGWVGMTALVLRLELEAINGDDEDAYQDASYEFKMAQLTYHWVKEDTLRNYYAGQIREARTHDMVHKRSGEAAFSGRDGKKVAKPEQEAPAALQISTAATQVASDALQAPTNALQTSIIADRISRKRSGDDDLESDEETFVGEDERPVQHRVLQTRSKRLRGPQADEDAT